MRKRWAIPVAAAMVIVAAGAALVAPRFATRVQTQPHEAAEYVLTPGTYRAGLSRTFINRHHMRAAESDTYDVLLIGDSVALGWARIDQADIAVSLLADRLGVVVGNISANSWGPPNQLGYVDTYGLFGARVVVFLWSSHDASDVPGLDPQEEPRAEAMDAAAKLIRRVREAGVTPIIALHREVHERVGDTDPGYRAFEQLAADADVPLVHLSLPVEAYMDKIHPNGQGQRLIADQLEPAIRAALR